MKTVIRLCLLGLLLYLANFTGVIVGFMIFKLIGGNQLSIQIPVAIVASFVGFVSLEYTGRKIFSKTFLYKPVDLFWIFAAALIWNPMIFIGIHYVTQGYLTRLGNLVMMMLFQILVNSITLFLAYCLWLNKQNACEDEL